MTAFRYIEDGLELFEQYSQQHDKVYISKNRLPRNHVWRPYRFAVNDIIIGLTVVKHERNNNCLLVDVCLTDNNPALVDHTGARVVMGFLLSEAFKCGGSMEIRFTEEVEGGRVPKNMVALAAFHKIKLLYVDQGRIAASEAIALYMAITDFSDDARAKIADLVRKGSLAYERTCYMVHHGVWSDREMDQIVLGARRPDSIIHGSFYDIERNYLLYMNDVVHARGALLGGYLDQILKYRERSQGDVVYDLEGDDRSLTINFDLRLYAKRYTSGEDIPIPWLSGKSTSPAVVPTGTELVVFIRQRGDHEVSMFLQDDLDKIEKMIASEASQPQSHQYYMIIPYDFMTMPAEFVTQVVEKANAVQLGIIVYPARASQLDDDVVKKFKVSRSLRAKRGGSKPSLSTSARVQLMAFSRGRYEAIPYAEELLSIQERIATGVSLEREKSRYYLVARRLEEALISETPVYSQMLSDMYVALLDIIADASQRQLPTGIQVYSPEMVTEQLASFRSTIPEQLLKVADIAKRVAFLEYAREHNCYVLEVQDALALGEQRTFEKLPVPVSVLRREPGEEKFVDNSKRNPVDVFTETVTRALASRLGDPSSFINFSNPSHTTSTEVLNRFVFTDGAVDPKFVRVAYDDGSEAMPFPVNCLKRRTKEEVRALRGSGHPLPTGLVSMRHQDMDAIVSMYWFRNTEVSVRNMSIAEVDAYCYQKTREKLARVRKDREHFRIFLYHTGLEPAIVGFYRGIVDDMREHIDDPPFIEVVPHYHARNTYRQGTSWY